MVPKLSEPQGNKDQVTRYLG